MTFPWKKPKSNLFSRLVADLHRPPKRGRTLVVETGFPTSLVDLIVKNRDRLRKSPKRNPTSTQIQRTFTQSFPAPPCDQQVQSPRVDVGKLVVVQSERAGSGRIAFKVIIVAALAVSTKQLTLWIMMAAFFLLLIEFVGVTVFGFSAPESCTVLLGSWIGKGLLGFKKRTPSAQQALVLPDSIELIELEDDCVQEIQIIESESDCAGETEIEVEEMETKEKIELRRSGRIKRHLIKKLVPKKLRHRKKKNEDQWGADIHKTELEEESQEEEIQRVDKVLWEESEMGRVKEEKAEKGPSRQRLSGNVIVIVLLAGLVLGGRGAALLITLVWCLMVTYIGRFRC
ncbi:hypothetical protein F3Y22_tig00116965pilonHSYRG00180 [Hibiscus syriacus]|uniref:Uncharacterized protein n=1 Tax=Hibiscus syriacus TaxID=106335 RepID=A0A6A2WJV8_HIBSY|nr:uncharacterized protein LOC120191178 [Hibiscus syriacus]KAE8658901.1 hypothetical protein F3Y22_tig00116965pilonHSYRG00180 [Hibiscus syriacus]